MCVDHRSRAVFPILLYLFFFLHSVENQVNNDLNMKCVSLKKRERYQKKQGIEALSKSQLTVSLKVMQGSNIATWPACSVSTCLSPLPKAKVADIPITPGSLHDARTLSSGLHAGILPTETSPQP